ncbi:MAG TPA: MmgE/PrpD family protein [Candidatus Dormibacteraeota bacterium]|nr:MmgE/PrpD family protein [Candidatus Dormibacteraeota bacterium]
MTARSLTRDFIDAVWVLRAGEDDLAALRSLLFDHIGVTAAGAQTETARVVRRLVTSGHGPALPVIGTELSAAAADAAFANAVAGHCLEFDDTHSGASLHPGVVVFPAALAASVLSGASPEQFVEGVVTGYEVMCRVGRAVDPAAHYRRHFHPTATVGHLAAAAAAARIMGLSAERAAEAVGVACTMAAGSLEFLSDGAWTKRLHPGLAVRNGLLAAQLVEAGFRGPVDGLGGPHGFLASYTDDPHPSRLLDGLGVDRLEIRNTSIKAHGCCRYNQGPIDGVVALRRRLELVPADVKSIRVGVVSAAPTLIWNPPEQKRRPSSVVDAQFSLPYSVAVALIEGNADPNVFEPVRNGDPELQRLMNAVSCVVDPELDRHYPDQWRCWVEIETVDGRTQTERVDEPKGEPGNPFSAEELREKVARLTAGIYSPAELDAISDALTALPASGSFDALIAAITSKAGLLTWD